MRGLLITVLIALALWTGYWFLGAQMTEVAVRDWFAAQSRQGVMAGHDGLTVKGFPTRFDLTLTRPHVEETARGIAWSAPSARLTAQSFRPWQVTADLPEQQTITLPDQEISIASSGMTAVLALRPSTGLPLDHTMVAVDGLSLISSKGWSAAAARITAASQQTAGDPLTHDLRLSATSITPDEAFRSRLAGVSALPELIDSVQLDAAISLSAPLDRFAAELQPRVTGLRLRDARLVWGRLVLSAQGEIVPGPDGRAEGTLDLRAESWRELPAILVAAGLVKPEVAPTVTRAMEVLAAQSGSATSEDGTETLDVPLTFTEGWMRLGPIPLGPALLMQ